MTEYALWGYPPNSDTHTLLLAMPGGKPITTRNEAEKYVKILSEEHGCTRVTIQVLDGTLPDFSQV